MFIFYFPGSPLAIAIAQAISGRAQLVPARHASRARNMSLMRLASRCGRGAKSYRMKEMFYTYVLISQKDGKLYVGFAEDLKNRISDHNNGLVGSTKSRRPLQLIYYEACVSKDKAIQREKYFKTGFGRRFLKNRI